jgi:hypothetical protein
MGMVKPADAVPATYAGAVGKEPTVLVMLIKPFRTAGKGSVMASSP